MNSSTFQRYHLLDAEATRLVAKPESFHGLAQSHDGADHSLPDDAAWIELDVSFSSYILQPHRHDLHRKGIVRCLLGRPVPEREVRVSQLATGRFRALPVYQKHADDWWLEVLLCHYAQIDHWTSRVHLLFVTVRDRGDFWKRKPSA